MTEGRIKEIDSSSYFFLLDRSLPEVHERMRKKGLCSQKPCMDCHTDNGLHRTGYISVE